MTAAVRSVPSKRSWSGLSEAREEAEGAEENEGEGSPYGEAGETDGAEVGDRSGCREAAYVPRRARRRMICGRLWRQGFWFRVFGYGVAVELRSWHMRLFSERQGYKRVYYLGPICWEWLRGWGG